jgi:hypothetical protein
MAVELTSLYILYPDGRKEYLNEKIVEYHSIRHGMKTASGHPIIDESEEKGE